MRRRQFLRRAGIAAGATTLGLGLRPARAEVGEVRLSHGYGLLYLPLMILRDRKLLEKHAASAGLGGVAVSWQLLDGGNVINDAMLAGALDIAGTGSPGFVTLWAKAHGIARSEIIGVCGLSTCALALNTNRPEIKGLADFTPGTKIALPGIKTSLAAVVLEMLVAKEFGQANYAKLDPMTVGVPHPEAYAALMSGKTEIAAHFASPPYSILELADPRIHTVITASAVLGASTLDVVFAPKRFVDANPKTILAFLRAMDEANKSIVEDPQGAAQSFIRVTQSKQSEAEVVAMIKEKDTGFSTTPNGVMQYADFLHTVGSIKTHPESWKDLFMPAVHELQGS
ncbi:MAG: ABC transporter substrate-binding protein [Alphaproteobacteria bacterium]|nr:ABC transporter substrate-binding protein [Alphaproteobacteria bacterium]